MTKSSIWSPSVYDGLTIVYAPKWTKITKTFLVVSFVSNSFHGVRLLT